VVRVRLVVGLALHVRVVEQTDRAHLICDHHYGLAKQLLDLHNRVLLVVLVTQSFETTVGAQAFA